jgi:hypothetical protein
LLEDEQTSNHGGGGRYNPILEFKGEQIKKTLMRKKKKKMRKKEEKKKEKSEYKERNEKRKR